jgi:formylmethanofuran dehydrogenase subunit A
MSSDWLKIQGGTVHDPANGVDGQVLDLWIQDGKLVAAPADPTVRPSRVIDARGLVVMPGGVDMHCHIVGPKVNSGRLLTSDETRRGDRITPLADRPGGRMGPVPSSFVTG